MLGNRKENRNLMMLLLTRDVLKGPDVDLHMGYILPNKSVWFVFTIRIRYSTTEPNESK